ncbi:hypothetical protein [Sporomusa acidovorans]|uniref:Uncharacterized protein n=1 Tax=Sporomusa acidovorans (strain ATCC 49682 / DSM 3132 / Mol) TaxID=1123286 RepID=A0ABZ3IZI0_SPOA4|nr:hypothetical protein [Sporomusa acidovorans]OZC17220.1 hypothetical protein SPACI_38700 [Sporomusa acidovorans DSM 3132]SDF15050.1 NitT/TauT family transport system substrate-binding protein [Sporomusa acidovorans]
MLKEDPQRFQAFLEGIIRSEKIKAENPELAVKINNKYLKLDEAVIRDFTLEPHSINSSDPNRKGVIRTFEEMAAMGYLQPQINPADYINIELYQNALAKVLKTYPDDAFFKGLEKRFAEQNLN